MKTTPQEEQLARKLHEWYLEATQVLNPKNYNPLAQKPYDALNEQQKEIDRYIAKKILTRYYKEIYKTLKKARGHVPVGYLRQWLNEDRITSKPMVTDEDLLRFIKIGYEAH